MKRGLAVLLLGALLLGTACVPKKDGLYTIGLFQVNEAPTLSEVRQGFLRSLDAHGLRDGVNIRLKIRNAMGDIAEVHRIAEEFVRERVDLIVAMSTPCLQAALIATRKIPIVFTSVANPYLLNAGKSARDHLENVTGISSQGPIKETLAFVRQALPQTRRLGTLWTPAELNSEFYLELARQAASELGFEIVTVPVTNANDVFFSAQLLVNKKIDAINQLSDNTINAAFDILGRVAEESGIPLFGGFLSATRHGACAAMGWDFFDMGLKTGDLVLRVKNGERPRGIPFESMSVIKLSLNLTAAQRQGLTFPQAIVARADEVLISEVAPADRRP